MLEVRDNPFGLELERRLASRLVKLPSAVLERMAGGPKWDGPHRLDPRIRFLTFLRGIVRRPALESLSVEAARAEYRRALVLLNEVHVPVFDVKQILAEDVPIRIYTPHHCPDPAGALVYFHGGGGVIGDLDTCDAPCRFLAEQGGMLVISVDYRLGPEHRFPAGLDDAKTVLQWVRTQAAELRVNADRILVGGDSFGASLAAGACLALKAEGLPQPRGQVLIYPVTDFARTGGSRDDFAQGYLLDASLIAWFRDHTFSEPKDRLHPLASVLRAEDLTGLCPAVVVTAGFDPLRDEGQAYAARLREAGVSVIEQHHPHLTHAFLSFASVVSAAGRATEDLVQAIRVILLTDLGP